MIKTLQSTMRNQGGNAAVEFGSLMATHFRMDKATTAGVSHALYNRDDVAGIQAASLSASGFDAADVSVSVILSCECPSGGVISCTATCPVDGYKRVLLEVRIDHTHQSQFNLLSETGDVPMSRSAIVQLP
jgi:hypothetical protein